MSKAAQGFSPEAYFSTSRVETRGLRLVETSLRLGERTPLIGKIAIYGWKQVDILNCI